MDPRQLDAWVDILVISYFAGLRVRVATFGLRVITCRPWVGNCGSGSLLAGCRS